MGLQASRTCTHLFSHKVRALRAAGDLLAGSSQTLMRGVSDGTVGEPTQKAIEPKRRADAPKPTFRDFGQSPPTSHRLCTDMLAAGPLLVVF